MMETMIPPQVGMGLRTKNKKKEAIKKREKAQIKNERKERRGNSIILVPHLYYTVAA